MRALQALDAAAAGATEREIAELVFWESPPSETFNDSALRGHVRYLVDVGEKFRDGGYRDLVWPQPPKPRRRQSKREEEA